MPIFCTALSLTKANAKTTDQKIRRRIVASVATFAPRRTPPQPRSFPPLLDLLTRRIPPASAEIVSIPNAAPVDGPAAAKLQWFHFQEFNYDELAMLANFFLFIHVYVYMLKVQVPYKSYLLQLNDFCQCDVRSYALNRSPENCSLTTLKQWYRSR